MTNMIEKGVEDMGDEPSLRQEHPALLALLEAAKPFGLKRCQGSLVAPLSRFPDVGWFTRSPYSEFATSTEKGGPWSLEAVTHACARGFLAISDKTPERATITRAGKQMLTAAKPKKGRKDGSSLSPSNPSHNPGEEG